MKRELPFIAGLLYELALLVLALFWGSLFDRSVFAGFQWSFGVAGLGIIGAVPPFVFFIWSLKTKWPLFTRHQELLEALLRPVFAKWSLPRLLLLSLCTGVAEEALFRGAIQGSLAERVGAAPALLLASLAFGAAHMITWTYAITAAVIGAYLGLLWIWTGNLLSPMMAHALYDFAALVYFLRRRQN